MFCTPTSICLAHGPKLGTYMLSVASLCMVCSVLALLLALYLSIPFVWNHKADGSLPDILSSPIYPLQLPSSEAVQVSKESVHTLLSQRVEARRGPKEQKMLILFLFQITSFHDFVNRQAVQKKLRTNSSHRPELREQMLVKQRAQ